MHVSHLNAAHDSPSAFYRSKAKGEELVKEAFPGATIVRPSIMFGYEDKLLNNMASECPFHAHAMMVLLAHWIHTFLQSGPSGGS